MSEAEDFLKVAYDYQLGALDTEAQHPETLNLSDWAQHDLPEALTALKGVDRHMLDCLAERSSDLMELSQAIAQTFKDGGRIFLCGCGATGRLSLSLEQFSRTGILLPKDRQDSVIAFMAGGDAALIRSIERFEDHPEYGARQLEELGFREGDLLISSTEGGETPFVIGATERATELSSTPPYFLYCNPDEVLCRIVERSCRVISNPQIKKINLSVGPMALSGSTRMQSSTILMAAIGYAFMFHETPSAILEAVKKLREWFESVNYGFLEPFIVEEAAAYQGGEYVTYLTRTFGITVLTDTTERSPTFALTPFENRFNSTDLPSWCYVCLTGTESAEEAWRYLLAREPRPLEWGSLRHLTGAEAMKGFDFSNRLVDARKERIRGAKQWEFSITESEEEEGIRFSFRGLTHHVPGIGIRPFEQHLMLKMLLNAHSTLVMGRMGRYVGNLMTYVNASNYKLIDRAIRYTRLLLKRDHSLEPSYEAVANQIFVERQNLKPNEPIVVKTVQALSGMMAIDEG